MGVRQPIETVPQFPMISEAAVAIRLGVSKAALRVWRRQGRGPVFCRFGKCVRYSPRDVEQ